MPESRAASVPAATPLDEAREARVAVGLVAVVLATLMLVKPLGPIPVVGTLGFTFAAGLQLYLPLWRAERLGVPIGYFGLHLGAWRKELRLVLLLCAVTFPPFILAHHLYMTEANEWVRALGLDVLAGRIPRRVLAPRWPTDLAGLGLGVAWMLEVVATHTLGVALPEEAFYRGYVQPRLETRWPPRHRVLGARIGVAAVLTTALFALGHFLGEWNPLRLGPFFPGLAFAWLRSATGSVTGAVGYHALCNILGELLFSAYRPG